MSNDNKRIKCVRSDTGLVRHAKYFNLGTKSKTRNTTEQMDVSDTTSPEFSATASWEYEDTTESDSTSIFADITEGSNASKSEDPHRKFRSGIINYATNLPGPAWTQSTEGKVLIDCKNPDTTCITVNCSLYGPIGSRSRPYVSFRMSATTEDLGEFTSPYGVVKVRLL